MDFKEATDGLFAKVDHEDLAKALGVSVASIRQARLRDDANAHRQPPGKWQNAVIRLAEKQREHYATLLRRLKGQNDNETDITGIKRPPIPGGSKPLN